MPIAVQIVEHLCLFAALTAFAHVTNGLLQLGRRLDEHFHNLLNPPFGRHEVQKELALSGF